MRLGRIASPDGVAFVSIEGEGDSATAKEIAEHPFGTPTFTGRSWPLADVRLLAPILASKVIAVGRNYAAHAAESGNEVPEEPVIFLKPNTSIVGPGAPIVIPRAQSSARRTGSWRRRVRRSSDTPSRTTSRPATTRRPTDSGREPRGTTRSARWGRGSRPTSTPRISRSRRRSTGSSVSGAGLL